MSRSIAFKCTYNDGDEGMFVGFAGTCSPSNIRRNVFENPRVNCSSGRCRKFFDHGMKGELPDPPPCYEGKLFLDWRFGAGSVVRGPNAGRDFHLTQTGRGKFAVLTTRFPNDEEKDRKIIGLFRIDAVEDNNTVLSKHGGIRLPLEEAKTLDFWAYSNNRPKKPNWGNGLFRYLDDGQVHRILTDVATTVRDEGTRGRVNVLIQQAFGDRTPPRANGCLRVKSLSRPASVAAIRKYGPGGEGEDHRKLKNWIFENPEVIGLSSVKDKKKEYPFISGDSADIVFRHGSGASTVVEIETGVPFPGAFQVIKYRALLCAQGGLPLDSRDVIGMLVAWSIPSEVRAFCDKYGILWRECRAPAAPRS